jgi:NAD(P)H-nitrite reductase large subunit
VPGTTLHGVFVFRTLDDCRNIAEYAKGSKRAVVIGGGLLGLEAAKGLMTHNLEEVTVVEFGPWLMGVQLDEVGGNVLQKTIEKLGIKVRVKTNTTELRGYTQVESVKFADGTEQPADMVVISAGIRPNVDLAKECGLKCDRAIVVDDQLRTNDPYVFGVGECVQHRSMIYGLVAPLWEQTKVLAKVLTEVDFASPTLWQIPEVPEGETPPPLDLPAYTGSKIATKLKVMGVELASMGRIGDLKEIDERDARFINDRVHANIQKDGTFSVVPRIYGGVTTADDLIKIGQVAKKYDVPMVKVTGGQRIDLLGVKKDDLPKMWADLGMPSGYAYTKAFRTCKTCVGSEFCRYGTNDSTALGIAIEKRFQGFEFPAKMKLAVSGCPRNCAEATVKDLGVIATEGGEWEISIGGAAGASVRKTDILCRVKTQEEALRIIGRFFIYYRDNAKWLERTYDFVPRIGLDKIKKILLEDELGLCDYFDREVEATIAAYVDPWMERERPAFSGQFEDSRSIALPMVS